MRLQNTYLGDLSTRAPCDEAGDEVPGTNFLRELPLLSSYRCIKTGSEAWYMKVANTGAATDWKMLLRIDASVTGDLTLTGTLTAGDVIITP
jgi:hypothetical protein